VSIAIGTDHTIHYCPVYRVNWLKAGAQHSRWKEDWTLVNFEMMWLLLFFDIKARGWQRRSEESTGKGLIGHSCYALQQKGMWETCARQAKEAFEKVRRRAAEDNEKRREGADD